ncbi:MAG TPA: hypothetical protein VE685_22460 [Thermoanaerobaculia bacterium]|nr:hypothetical protein [Thermoanaerobaculia bacterium]
MKHPSDDDLILFFYGEAEDAEAIRRQLEASPELRARYETLREVLEAVDDGPVPERGESYGAAIWARLQPRLPERRKPAGWGSFSLDLRWAFAGLAAALLLVAGFVAGRLWPRPEARVAEGTDGRERILLAAVADHLQRSERLLAEVANAGTADTAVLDAERAWAQDLLAANRLYRQSTRQGGRPRLAALLDELEPFLLELANSPLEPTGGELEDLRRRVEEQALLFKVRVVGERLDQQQTL